VASVFNKLKVLLRPRRAAQWFYARRYYFLRKVTRSGVPQHNLSYLPDGFTITKIGQTGVAVADNFCTPGEAKALIEMAEPSVEPSAVLQDGKFVLADGRQSDTACVFGPNRRDPELMPFACRAAALTGLPYNHLEAVYVTRYREGGFYDEHVDYGDDFSVDRLYTVLLYLNDMEPGQGGSTAFPNLHIEVQPRVGRAVSWTNMNPDGSAHVETSHIAMPVKAGGEKWTIQFWFHPYKMFKEIKIVPPQTAAGLPLRKDADLPDGASYFERSDQPD
jgi:prolyl 4-hydroxylase